LEDDLGIEPQRRRTAMERYLGADVHAASVTFCMLDASGKQIRRDGVETYGKALVGYLQQLPGNLHLCLEEGEWSQWLYEKFGPLWAITVVARGPDGSMVRRPTSFTARGEGGGRRRMSLDGVGRSPTPDVRRPEVVEHGRGSLSTSPSMEGAAS
jgi:hypothetical protein